MNPTLITEELSRKDVAQLLLDVERYLAAVELFRAEGCGPAWRDDEGLAERWRIDWSAEPAAGLVSVDSQ